MAFRWPWQRRPSSAEPVSEPAPAPSPAAPPAPSPMGWAFLPPIQRQLATGIAPISRDFHPGAWQSPQFTGDLTHAVGDGLPSGVIDGDGSGLGGPVAGSWRAPEMTLLPPPPPAARRPSVQRHATSPVAPVTPTTAGSLMRADPTGLPVARPPVIAEAVPPALSDMPEASAAFADTVADGTPDVAPDAVVDRSADPAVSERPVAPTGAPAGPAPTESESPLPIVQRAADASVPPRADRPRLGLGAPLAQVPETAVSDPPAPSQSVGPAAGSDGYTELAIPGRRAVPATPAAPATPVRPTPPARPASPALPVQRATTSPRTPAAAAAGASSDPAAASAPVSDEVATAPLSDEATSAVAPVETTSDEHVPPHRPADPPDASTPSSPESTESAADTSPTPAVGTDAVAASGSAPPPADPGNATSDAVSPMSSAAAADPAAPGATAVQRSASVGTPIQVSVPVTPTLTSAVLPLVSGIGTSIQRASVLPGAGRPVPGMTVRAAGTPAPRIGRVVPVQRVAADFPPSSGQAGTASRGRAAPATGSAAHDGTGVAQRTAYSTSPAKTGGPNGTTPSTPGPSATGGPLQETTAGGAVGDPAVHLGSAPVDMWSPAPADDPPMSRLSEPAPLQRSTSLPVAGVPPAPGADGSATSVTPAGARATTPTDGLDPVGPVDPGRAPDDAPSVAPLDGAPVSLRPETASLQRSTSLPVAGVAPTSTDGPAAPLQRSRWLPGISPRLPALPGSLGSVPSVPRLPLPARPALGSRPAIADLASEVADQVPDVGQAVDAARDAGGSAVSGATDAVSGAADAVTGAVGAAAQRGVDALGAGAAASADRGEGGDEALAERLFPPMLRMLRSELLLDRERRGGRTDRW